MKSQGPLLAEQVSLYERYVLAMINNMIVSFGGVALAVYLDTSDEVLLGICRRVIAAFDLDAPKNCRCGCGVYINYTNRMNRFLDLGRFSMRCADIRDFSEPDPARTFYLYEPGDEEAELDVLRRSAMELDGKCFCSLDVGGNSIKSAVVLNGEILLVKEHKWYPTGCRYACEMNDPQLLQIRFLGLMTQLLQSGSPLEFQEALSPTASCALLESACERLEARGFRAEGVFDAVVIGFPGHCGTQQDRRGRVLQAPGHEDQPGCRLRGGVREDLLAGRYGAKICAQGRRRDRAQRRQRRVLHHLRRTGVFPGGSMICEYGMFANTIGTEMGTGFISRAGTIQHVPLEGFQHIIDLGSLRETGFPAADVRSINSMNTGLPGTVQKYVSQLGLFRMSINGFLHSDPGLVDQLISDGLLTRGADGRLAVTVSPVDQRGRLTHHLIGMLDEENPVVSDAFSMMGKALGVLIDLDRAIFPEISCSRLLSGGIVSSDKAFSRIVQGLKAHNPTYEVLRLDEETTNSPLLRRMKSDQRNFNVAIGSAYIGNRFLVEAQRREIQL